LINNFHPTFKLPISHKNVKSLIAKVMHGEDCKLNEVIVNFVSDKKIKEINKKYLKHNYFTDIITFPYNSKQNTIEGELFISLDTVKNNGIFYRSGYKRELKRVIIHGCLHLAGYKDGTKKDKELINNKENFYLKGN
jgi:rRNA maturation RNase YbeY